MSANRSEQTTAGAGKKQVTLVTILAIQAAVIIYTGSGICAKMAGMNRGSITLLGREIRFFSWTGYMWLFLEVACLGVYAILWQQIIKRVDLSVAYANRAFAICWSFLWGILLFRETFRPINLLGIALVLSGILLVNQDARNV